MSQSGFLMHMQVALGCSMVTVIPGKTCTEQDLRKRSKKAGIVSRCSRLRVLGDRAAVCFPGILKVKASERAQERLEELGRVIHSRS